MQATMSVMGLYEYDNSIFKDFHLPEGIEKQLIVDSILMECAELEVIYPSPVMMQKAIDVWSAAHVTIWERLYKTTLLEYNPIHNYDRTEEWEDNEEENGGKTRDVNGSVSRNMSDEAESIEQVSAFDSGSFENRGKTTTNANGNEKTVNEAGENEEENRNKHSTHRARMSGNIGVTTTQKMLLDEREVSRYNIYDEIVNDFKNRFCLLVY